jgi:predicted MFS family arabinose efflux permease
VLPLWLTQRESGPELVGIFASAEWAGILLGVALAPPLISRCGFARTVLLGLGLSLLGFAAVATGQRLLLLFGGALIGIGMGLRWIGAETPLFRGVAAQIRGRIIGLHELLIAGAPMLAPELTLRLASRGIGPLVIGGLAMVVAIGPLVFASRWPPMNQPSPASEGSPLLRRKWSGELVNAACVAVVAGLCNGALYGLLAVYGVARGMPSAEIGHLIVFAGAGAAVAQYPVGWLVDRSGALLSSLMLAVAAVVASIALLLSAGMFLQTLAVLCFAGSVRAMLTLATCIATSGSSTRADENMRLVAGCFSVGAVLGPVSAGILMGHCGVSALPIYFSILSGGLMVHLACKVAVGRRN